MTRVLVLVEVQVPMQILTITIYRYTIKIKVFYLLQVQLFTMTQSRIRRPLSHRLRPRLPIASPLSPNAAKLKKQTEAMNRKATIAKAALEVKSFKSGNGGSSKYGLVSTIVKKYQSIGYEYVTRGSIAHYFVQEKLTLAKKPAMIPNTIEHGGGSTIPSVINLSDTSSNGVSTVTTNEVVFVERSDPGGRPKGTTKKAQNINKNRMASAITKAATMFSDARRSARQIGKKVENGLLKKVIHEAENEFGLVNGVLNMATIKQRVDRNNLTGMAHQRTSHQQQSSTKQQTTLPTQSVINKVVQRQQRTEVLYRF